MRLVHLRARTEDERTKAARRKREDKKIGFVDVDYLGHELIDVGK